MAHGLFWNAVPKSEAAYAPLDQGCSCDEDEGADRFPTRRSGWSQTTKRLVQVFVVSQLIVLPAGAVIWWLNRQAPMNMYLKKVSSYSPLLNQIEIPMTLRFDEPQTLSGGGGGDMTWGSRPNQEIDRMWEEITSESSIPVTESDVIAMKKDPSVAAMLPEEYQTGNEKTYLGHALVFHRLHCLNYIRKALYKDYYYPNGTEEVPMHEHHIAHCIAMVLDHITCAGDPGVYDIPLPDANTWGKCWDFKQFRKDFDKIALKDLNPFQMVKPPGAKSVTEHNNLQEVIYKTAQEKTHKNS